MSTWFACCCNRIEQRSGGVALGEWGSLCSMGGCLLLRAVVTYYKPFGFYKTCGISVIVALFDAALPAGGRWDVLGIFACRVAAGMF